MVDTQSLELNGITSPFVTEPNPKVAEMRAHFQALVALDELCAHLDVDTQLIDLSQVDEVQAESLYALHRVLVQGEESTDDRENGARLVLPIGPWNLMLLVTPGSAEGKWKMIDPFSAEARRQFLWEAEGGNSSGFIPVTAYDIVEDT